MCCPGDFVACFSLTPYGRLRTVACWGVRTDRYKLIYFNRLDQWELFDLAADPREMRNVYSDSNYQEKLVGLKAEITRWRTVLDDRDQFSDIQQDNP
jgi:arylsulfatase A-like enzyme